MYAKPILFLASLLYKYCFSLYKPLYFFYKKEKDKEEIMLFGKIVKKGDIVIDIGANIGFYTILFSNLVGKEGRVYAFEPENENYNRLKKNTKNLKNVSLYKQAISNSSKSLKIYTSSLINVDHKTYKTSSYKKSYRVKATSVDNFLRGRRVSFIKMDIQGAEFTALKGMKQTLVKNRNIKMYLECWPKGLQENNSSPKQLLNFFQKKQMKVRVVENNRLSVVTNKYIEECRLYKGYKFDNWLVTK